MYFNGLEYVKKSEICKKMIKSIEKDVALFMDNFNDDNRFLSGWGHEYFCPEDGGKLIYNIETPHNHVCSICKKDYRSFILDSVYITFLRNEAAVTAIKAGILHSVTGEAKYTEVIKKILSFYSDNYAYFALHAKKVISNNPTEDVGGGGKIMPQGLNEAIIMIRFINALELVKDSLDSSFLSDLKTNLFDKAVEIFIPQKQHIHNIPCWLNSAIGVIGLFYNDQNFIDEATVAPFNIYEQIKNGVTNAGFWYEGSIHYNFFALEGILNFFIFAGLYGNDIKQEACDKVFGMLNAAYNYAFDNDVFPNPSDGWPNLSLKTYSYVYYMGHKVFGEKLLPYLKHIEANPTDRPRIPLSEPYYFENKIPLERLMFIPDFIEKSENAGETQPRKSKQFEDSNCGILRNDWFNVFLKYGHQTVSHAHPDKMSIEVMVGGKVYTKDLSNSGYTSVMCNEWHRKNESHTTVMTDFKQSDIMSAGKLVSATSSSMTAVCRPYEGVEYQREILLENDVMVDNFKVSSDKEANFDYFYHFEEDIDLESAEISDKVTFENYPYIFDVNKIISQNGFIVIKSKSAVMTITLGEGQTAFVGKSYNNPANTLRNTLVINFNGKETIFSNSVKSN